MEGYNHVLRLNRLVPRVVTIISTIMMLSFAASLVLYR